MKFITIKGVNMLVVKAVEMDPFKSLLAGIVPTCLKWDAGWQNDCPSTRG
jgi:hypothetical protein